MKFVKVWQNQPGVPPWTLVNVSFHLGHPLVAILTPTYPYKWYTLGMSRGNIIPYKQTLCLHKGVKSDLSPPCRACVRFSAQKALLHEKNAETSKSCKSFSKLIHPHQGPTNFFMKKTSHDFSKKLNKSFFTYLY